LRAVKLLSVSAVFIFVAWLSLTLLSSNRYDENHPDYKYLISVISTDRKAFDPSRINSGDWQFMCVIGPYNKPANILQTEASRRRVKITAIDEVAVQAFSISAVEENEGALSYVDRSGRGRTMLVHGFGRLAEQHARKCFGQEAKEVVLPIRTIE
jgi:hypothetical protein